MPITGQGWEMLITREVEQDRDGYRRTVGRYQVYRDGVAQLGRDMKGETAESYGPGANRPAGNGLRIEAGRYPLSTQNGEHYVTFGYRESNDPTKFPHPGVELNSTGERTEILLHPGYGFLASVGCINPCTYLPYAEEDITFTSSRRRVIALIANMRGYCGEAFPETNGERIPNAFIVIDGEP